MKMYFFSLFTIFCFLLLFYACKFGSSSKIPLEDFFRKPEKVMVEISRDGKHISYLAPWKHRLNLFVRNLETQEEKQITFVTERDILKYFWANNDTIIYLQDFKGDENHHIFSISREGGEVKDLTPFEGVKCAIVDDLEEVEDKLLFAMNERNKEIFDVYQLDINTAKIEPITENPGDVVDWVTDHKGVVRVAVASDGLDTVIRHRLNNEDEWQKIATYPFRDTVDPLLFTFDNNKLYVSSNVNRDKQAIYEYDLTTGKTDKMIFEHSQVDVSTLLQSKERKKIVGVAYVTDKVKYEFFDELREKIQNFIDDKLPGYENNLVSHNKEETKYIVRSWSDKTRGSYHLLDISGDAKNWSLTKIFDISPWLKESQLASMEPITYISRDDLTIHGYLTIPPNKKPRNLPLVVHPHGGPWTRDTWGFNPFVQFLANRGYAVLQVNFRASTGYGKKFWEAGFKQWGLAMQDDITDGVEWAIKEGIANPKKIAIYGASYGGYATLSGITKTPDLYAAAIDYVGVSNLFTLLESIPPYWKLLKQKMMEQIGDPKVDKEQMIQTSPALNAHKIKTPLFIAQGANDPRVKKAESDQMVEALKKRGIKVEYMVKDNEGHGFLLEENQFDFYRAMEKFLEKHLKP